MHGRPQSGAGLNSSWEVLVVIPICQLTDGEKASYEPIWGEFTEFNWVFRGSGRTFGFYGHLNVEDSGVVSLEKLVVACSCEHCQDQLRHELGGLGASILEQGWVQSASSLPIEGQRQEYRIRLMSDDTSDGTVASHLMLWHGDTDDLRNFHLTEGFLLRSATPADPAESMGHYYPISGKASPEIAVALSGPELAYAVRGKSVVCLTGAGISTSSGIPSFRGKGGLEESFPLHEPFPGAVAALMAEKPDVLASTLGTFQAGFIRAQPNAAHIALADLEKRGPVSRIITGNGDKLHERAGSQNVHLKSAAHFVDSEEGWEWICEGDVALVVGLGRDEHGLISYARDQGIRVIVIAPDRPEFLHPQDWYVEGKAEYILPRLVAVL